MATSLIPRDPRPKGNSLAATIKAAMSSVPEILRTWGKMPAVRTLLEYLGRKLPVLASFGIIGLFVGGRVGTILAVGALSALFFDTALAAWLQHRPLPVRPDGNAAERRLPAEPTRETGDAPGVPREPDA
jgi:hypothetical protein